jgi:hypothetical protein
MLARSPFLPPGFAPPQSGLAESKASSKVGGYEFRGIYQLGADYRFLVSEPRSRSGSWVEVGGDYDGYEVRGYNPDTETLTLFFNNKENQLKLAELESNPTPLPVSGQTQAPAARSQPAKPAPVRRTIRPASRAQPESGTTGGSAPPPPAWLQQLREEAAARRAQATGGLTPPDLGFSPSGTGGPGVEPPPMEKPPTPPPNLSAEDIPPPPAELPPAPPPEIWEKIQQSMLSKPPRG